jgi:hypothetical protein
MKEILTYSKENNIDLRKMFSRKDTKNNNFLDVVTFGEVMTTNKMEVINLFNILLVI